MTGPGDRGRPGSFRPRELDGAEGGPLDPRELATAARAARDLEASLPDRATPLSDTGAFVDRVMASVAAEPLPAPAHAARRAARSRRLRSLVAAVIDAWHVTWSAGRPAAARMQAIGLVLVVVLMMGSVAALAAVGAATLLGPRPTVSPPPVASPLETPTPSPSSVPTPSPSSPFEASPSPTPTASPSAEPTDTPEASGPGPSATDNSGDGGGSAGPVPRPTAVPTSGETLRPAETPGTTETPEPTGPEDHQGGSETPQPTERSGGDGGASGG